VSFATVSGVPTIEVRSRIPGGAGEAPPRVLVELESVRTSVRDLIRCAVEEQVRKLRADALFSAEADRDRLSARSREALDRQYLSDAEIRAQAAGGTIRYRTREATLPDPAEEVARAQQAFADGVFVIFSGGRQATGLDDEIEVRVGEPVMFLRLVPLVGG
jgi:hypothetical protein